MKNNIWAKTTLSCYRYLEKICDAIDGLVETSAMNSFYVSTNSSQNSIAKVADKIIELSQRKITLINLKVIIENALSNCGELQTNILTEKYIEKNKAQDIAQRYGLSMRTYFRRLDDAESAFASQMTKSGFNPKFIQELKRERWIMRLYDSYTGEKESEG